MTDQHERASGRLLLHRLLDYVHEQAKEVDPRGYRLGAVKGFVRRGDDLVGLPGVESDLKVAGDHIWLRIQRLEADAPPPVPESLKGLFRVSKSPEGPLWRDRDWTATRCPGDPVRRKRAQIRSAFGRYSGADLAARPPVDRRGSEVLPGAGRSPHTDGQRAEWMRDLLGKASSTTQVIVMTCHPEQYQLTGGKGAVNTVDLLPVIKRSAVGQEVDHHSPPTAVNDATREIVRPVAPAKSSTDSPERRPGRRAKSAGESADLAEMLRRSLDKKK